MVEHIGDYEQYTTIYQMKREFDEKNELIRSKWKPLRNTISDKLFCNMCK